MSLLRARRRRTAGIPAGLSLGALLPLGLLVGSFECDDDEEPAVAAPRTAA